MVKQKITDMRNIEHLRQKAEMITLTDEQLVNEITPKQKIALDLCRKGLNAAQIADSMGILEGAVIERLTGAIRNALEAQGSWQCGMPRSLRIRLRGRSGYMSGAYVEGKEDLLERMQAVTNKNAKRQLWYREGMRWLGVKLPDEPEAHRCELCGHVIKKTKLKS